MKKDIYTNSLLACDDVFADIANVNLMPEGVEIQAEDLEEVRTDFSYKDLKGTPHQLFRDCLKRIRSLGGCIGFIGFESQTDICNAMPVRSMGYNYAGYQKQVQDLMAQNAREGKPAYTKVLHDDQKLLPIVTVVLYFGKEPWERPLSIRDLLDIPEEQKEFWDAYVQDYKIKVIPMLHQPEEVRERYRSDYRVIADYLDYRDQGKKVLMEKMRDNTTPLVHPEQTCDLLHALSGDARFEMMKEIYTGYSEEEKEEKRNVCDLLDAVEEVGVKRGISLGISQGISEGRNQQIIKQVCIRLKRNKTAETIAEDLEEDIVLIQEMCDVARDFGPEYNMEKVYEAWEKRESL